MRTKEQIEQEWRQMQWIKQIVYGFGIPDESAKSYYEDRKRLQEEYNKL